VYQLIGRYPDDLALALTADDVEAARAAGRIAALLGAEGGQSIDSSLGALRGLYALGVRYLTLTHNQNTPWADAATDTPRHGGLTAFGREVVRECNRLGMLVDLSHVAATTMHATLDVSTAPAFFSHSNALARCPHPRNVPDDVLTRVADTDGVVMTTFVPGFLTADCAGWFTEMVAYVSANAASPADNDRLERQFAAANAMPPCGVADLADHIEHIREVAGLRHVGLGGDFDGTAELPTGVTGVDAYPSLLAELADRGWSDPELSQLTWHNGLRVLRETESAARAAQAERGPSRATLVALDGDRANVDE
jgi:membrane dipeptidase